MITKKKPLCSFLSSPQLFDLANDPLELENLADSVTSGPYMEMVNDRWDMTQYDRDVRKSQADRLVVYNALRQGTYKSWDHGPEANASERYMRNHLDLNELEASARFPRLER